jgi:hypothetical protein
MAGVAARGDILVSTSLDKDVFRRGERLDIHVTATNTSSEPVVLHFNDGRQAHYNIDGTIEFPEGWTLALTQRPIAANSSYTWTFRHDWFWRDLSLGSHNVVGGVIGHGDAGPVPFEVVPPTLPTSGFSIDFDTEESISEYWPVGVRFRSNTSGGSSRPGIHDGHLRINSGTYPPGFNIAADFDMPVHGIAAEVSAAVGVSITMVAKDAAGNVLDTSVSEPVGGLGNFVPVSVSSNSAIASVEWWPSNERSTVMVDNVLVSMPEPGGILLLMGVGGVMLSRRRR